ncbi:LOW QUALITY PROTEIN: putative pectinesterase 10 [Morus notabilis]|uniref:LOW QUALITY PROTEIN: putative pectinesterase 10 n=1 Tax=Morus notabilis TaxID=981085 RepID=UPI000CED67A9|nr:LOW QUALITY PROTEIN: putative pectinesterase 10 [Morus notabilis]
MQFLPPFLFVFILFNIANSSVAFRNININADRRGRSENVNNSDVASAIITVDQNGSGKFKTIQAAIDSIPSGNHDWIKIKISRGIYTEKVTIPPDKSYIFLQGLGREKTIVTFFDHERTDTSATFSSSSDNVVAKGISFKNSYNRAQGPSDINDIGISAGSHVKQALAARIYGDKSAFIECGFIGFQDTLWDATGRHYFSNCHFEGAIDFIFGFAQSYYENSLINVTVRTRLPTEIAVGFSTAQGRASANDPGGFVFEGGSVSGSGRVLLGRAYGAYSRVIFHGTDLGQVVAPQGWDAWSYKGHEDEFKGAGSNISERVAWEKKPGDIQQILQEYSRSSFIDQDGWIDKLPR